MGKAKNKKNLTTLAKNIKALREAFGETLKDLANIVGYGTNTVHYYETGRNEPDDETKSKIAMHYGITVSELMHSDLTNIDRIHIDYLAFYRNLRTIFPIVCTENALNNESFAKAYRLHNNAYNKAKNLQIEELIDPKTRNDFWYTFGYILGEAEAYYNNAYLNNQIEQETAASLLAIQYLSLSIYKGSLTFSELQNNNYAPIMLISKQSPSYKKIINNTEPLSDEEKKTISEEINSKESRGEIEKLKTVAKKKYNDLVYYYTALQFVFDLVDNDLEPFFNERIGGEMLEAFKSIGNKYSANYIDYNYKLFSSKTEADIKKRK